MKKLNAGQLEQWTVDYGKTAGLGPALLAKFVHHKHYEEETLLPWLLVMGEHGGIKAPSAYLAACLKSGKQAPDWAMAKAAQIIRDAQDALAEEFRGLLGGVNE